MVARAVAVRFDLHLPRVAASGVGEHDVDDE